MTLEKKIAELKTQHPTIQVGSDEAGYTILSNKDYEATIKQWADYEMAEEAKLAEIEKAISDKTVLLAKLGITADEAKLLLG